MRISTRLSASVLLLTAILLASKASAQVTCIQSFMAQSSQAGLSFAPSDVEELVSQVSAAIGLRPVGITVIPCVGVGKAVANYIDRSGVPKGDYIFYDPIWVREVIGTGLR